MATLLDHGVNTNDLLIGPSMAQTSILNQSPMRRTTSPDIRVTACTDDDESPRKSTPNKSEGESPLALPYSGKNESFSESDRYYTASSGEEYDEDDDDGEMCIRLDSDDDNDSLSGLHINLKTLQAVSSMLAHYSPIIQRDPNGNPVFVPPPPPPEDEEDENSSSVNGLEMFANEQTQSPAKSKDFKESDSNRNSKTQLGGSDYECAIQELEDVLLGQDQTLFSDAMTELTDVMEKMTLFSDDPEKEG